jgi:hypothetical protein
MYHRNAALGFAVLFALAALPAAADDCTRPGPAPVMPQGATATAEEMKSGHDALQKYVNELQKYQDCNEAQIQQASKDTKPEVKQHWRDEGNAAIDAATQIKNVYTAQLKAYKARQ